MTTALDGLTAVTRALSVQRLSAAFRELMFGMLRVATASALGGEVALEARVLDTGDDVRSLWIAAHVVAGGRRAHPDGGAGRRGCQRLAVVMDGRAGANATPGLGGTFWAEVRLVPAAPGTPSAAA